MPDNTESMQGADSKQRKGGKVIIIDVVVDSKKGDYTSIQTQLFFDMRKGMGKTLQGCWCWIERLQDHVHTWPHISH